MAERVKRDIATIGTVIALIIQFAAVIWWTSKLDARVYTIECWMRDTRPVVDRIAKMESCIESSGKKLDDLKATIDSMNNRMWALHNSKAKGDD